MTEKPLSDTRQEEWLETSIRILGHFRAAFERSADAMAKGDVVPARDADRQLSEYLKIVQKVMDEEAKLDERTARETGLVRERDLDLDAARAEIGRRLACLRAAGDRGSLPDGAE